MPALCSAVGSACSPPSSAEHGQPAGGLCRGSQRHNLQPAGPRGCPCFCWPGRCPFPAPAPSTCVTDVPASCTAHSSHVPAAAGEAAQLLGRVPSPRRCSDPAGPPIKTEHSPFLVRPGKGAMSQGSERPARQAPHTSSRRSHSYSTPLERAAQLLIAYEKCPHKIAQNS